MTINTLLKRIRATAWLVAASLPLLAAAAYPERTITLVVPYSAGGPVDSAARIVGKGLSEVLGVPVVVDNKVGAGGNIGSVAVARAKPDGYTLLVNTTALVTTPLLLASGAIDPLVSFQPLTKIGDVPALLVTGAGSRFDSLESLIRYGRQQPGKLTFASPGNGTSLHLASELFLLLADVRASHVPYKGSVPALMDVAEQRVDFMVDSFVTAYPQVQGGKLRSLAVSTAKRYDKAPGMPTMSESGVPGFDFSVWYGVFAPSGLAPAARDRLVSGLQRSLRLPGVQASLNAAGISVLATPPDVFSKELRAESDRWKSLVQRVGVDRLRD